MITSLSMFRSLALGQQYSSLGSQPILCGSIPGLVPKQLRFCRNYIEIMPSIAEGVKLGIQECQHQFRGRRWNCTTIKDNLAIFGPVLDKGNNSFLFFISLCVLTLGELRPPYFMQQQGISANLHLTLENSVALLRSKSRGHSQDWSLGSD